MYEYKTSTPRTRDGYALPSGINKGNPYGSRQEEYILDTPNYDVGALLVCFLKVRLPIYRHKSTRFQTRPELIGRMHDMYNNDNAIIFHSLNSFRQIIGGQTAKNKFQLYSMSMQGVGVRLH